MNRKHIYTLLVIALLLPGCSGKPSRVPVASVNITEASRKAIDEYDKNSDQQLDASEIKACPALDAAMANIDTDGSTTINVEEVQSYLHDMQARRVAMVRWNLRVFQNGKPLEGIVVKLEPAGFLQPGVLPAEGVSDQNGLVALSVPEEHRPAPNARVVHCGLYNIKITDPQKGTLTGQPSGVEVRPEGQADYGKAIINLSSKG